MIEVQVGNEIIEFPDTMSDQEIEDVLRKEYPQQKKAEFVPEQPKTLREKIATGAKLAPYATLAPPLAFPPLSAGIVGVSRLVEGIAEGEPVTEATKQGLKSAGIDLALGSISKIKKVGKLLLKQKKKNIADVAIKTAEDTVYENRDILKGMKKIPINKITETKEFVDAVGDKMGKSYDSLKNYIISKQQKAVSTGVLMRNPKAKKEFNKLLGKSGLELDPIVANKQVYTKLFDDLTDPNLTMDKLYKIRKQADDAIDWKSGEKLTQQPYYKIREFADKVLRNKKINTKAKEYGENTDKLRTLFENKITQQADKKIEGGMGRFVKNKSREEQDQLLKIYKEISKKGDKLENDIVSNIGEYVRAIQVANAIPKIKPNLLQKTSGKIPLIGDLLVEQYKKQLPLRLSAKEASEKLLVDKPVMTAGRKFIAGSDGLTPIQKEKKPLIRRKIKE
jgi:predicted RNA-binding protein Jag